MGDRPRSPDYYDRPIFCGNFPYDATPSEIERLFDRYGRVGRLDMKNGAQRSW